MSRHNNLSNHIKDKNPNQVICLSCNYRQMFCEGEAHFFSEDECLLVSSSTDDAAQANIFRSTAISASMPSAARRARGKNRRAVR